MPKFYVTCGSQTLITDAQMAGQAALRLIDEVLISCVWNYCDWRSSDETRREKLASEVLTHLGTIVQVSQCGDGASEAGEFQVAELFESWHRLMCAVQEKYVKVGLAKNRAFQRIESSFAKPRKPR